jgi:hypothetical protein
MYPRRRTPADCDTLCDARAAGRADAAPHARAQRGLALWAALALLALPAACDDEGGGAVDAGTGGTGGNAGTGGGGGNAGTGGGGGTGGGSPDAPVSPDATPDSAPMAGGTVLRTFVYHQLTDLNPGIMVQQRWHAAISGDGRGIAFVQNAYNPSRLFYINSDGSGLLEIDSYTLYCGCSPTVSISDDGTGIVWGTPADLRYVRSDGSGKKTLIETGGEISDFRISGDGTKVFFVTRRDDADRATPSTRYGRGVWVINVDGTGLTQVENTAAVAALYGVTEDKVFPFNGCGPSLGVSRDASRIVFAPNIVDVGNKVVTANGNGSGLQKIADSGGTYFIVGKVAISADGSKVLYTATTTDNNYDLVVAGFDGSGKRTLANTSTISFSGGGACGDPGLLTADGSKAYMSDVGLLFDTDGSGKKLSMTLGTWVTGPNLLTDRQYGGWMNGDGTRFSFVTQDKNNIVQLVLLELNPAARGMAPTIDMAQLTPAKLQKGAGPGNTVVSARVTAPGTLHGVSTVFARDGMKDNEVSAPQALVDTGMQGDGQAGDGVYSSNQASASASAAVGGRTLRIHAESTTSERRHGTVLELSDIQVE